MKVRLLNIVAIAAITLSASAIAQEASLERAMADYNSGLVAPNGSAGLTISGDARVRNVTADDVNALDADVRTRLNFSFNINDDASAFLQFTGNSNWGSKLTDPFIDPNSTFNGASDNDNVEFSQAWVNVNNALGDGGSTKIGASYYTFGSGRILGTDEWDGLPQAFEGLWYSNEAGGLNLNAFYMNLVEMGSTSSDVDLMGLTFDYELAGFALSPYWLRQSGDALPTEHHDWMGASFAGSLAGFGIDGEIAQFEAYGTDSVKAWAIGTSFELGALASMGLDSAITFNMTDAEAGFTVFESNVSHNQAGLSDIMRGGVWDGSDGDASSKSLGFSFSPAEGWSGALGYHDITVGGADWTEID
ncbi:MAG: alginate export family protein, partial [Planctomycetes bacterium]|nr:alginate export family protein [Planctomycetota bacterium]